MIKVAATREKIASRPQLSKGIGRPSRQTKGIGFSDPQRETVAVSASKSKSEPICVSDLFPKLSPNEARANIPILSQQEKKEWKEKIKRDYEASKTAFTTPLKIKFNYIYRTTVDKKIQIKREISTGGGSEPPAAPSASSESSSPRSGGKPEPLAPGEIGGP